MRTSVSREGLQGGDLPAVCVVTGEDADRRVRLRFDSLPDWTGLWVRLSRVHPRFVAALHARGQVPADT